jgi:hypothetical protein
VLDWSVAAVSDSDHCPAGNDHYSPVGNGETLRVLFEIVTKLPPTAGEHHRRGLGCAMRIAGSPPRGDGSKRDAERRPLERP